MFGAKHKRKVEEKFEQIDTLNQIISERAEEAERLEGVLAGLRASIEEIYAKCPGLNEKEALVAYFTKLNKEVTLLEQEVAAKNKELAEKNEAIGIVTAMMDIQNERKKLEAEKKRLSVYKNRMFDPQNIILAAYTVPNIDDIAIDAFEKIKEFKASLTYDVRTCYKSLGGSRIAILENYKETVFYGEGKYYANATIKQFVTLEEACLALGSDLYLREKVSAVEIHDLLQKFKAGFYFYGKTDLTIDEFMNMIKSGKREYNGTQELSSLLEIGEAR